MRREIIERLREIIERLREIIERRREIIEWRREIIERHREIIARRREIITGLLVSIERSLWFKLRNGRLSVGIRVGRRYNVKFVFVKIIWRNFESIYEISFFSSLVLL